MSIDDVLAELLERCRADHLSWINGDGAPYAPPDDGSILGAVGGFGPGGAETAQRQRMVASQWRRGTGTIEFLNGGTDGNLAWLVFIERGTVELHLLTSSGPDDAGRSLTTRKASSVDGTFA